MALEVTRVMHGFVARFDDAGGLQGAAVEFREVKTYAGEVLASRILDPQPVALGDADKLAEIGAAINAAALAQIEALQAAQAAQARELAQERERHAGELEAVRAQAGQAMAAQAAAEQRVLELRAQLEQRAALRFIKKWQLTAGLRTDDPAGALLAAFNAVIAGLPPAVRELWDGSSGVEEGSPFLALAKAPPLALTDAQLASMFERYPRITQADVLAMVKP